MESMTIIDKINAQMKRTRRDHETMTLKGTYRFTLIRKGEVVDYKEVHNVITNEGKKYLLDVGLNNETTYGQKTEWFVMLVSNDGPPPTPLATHEYDTFSGTTVTEFEDYTGGDTASDRVHYVGVVSTAKITNAASRAAFTITAANKDVYGAALVSEEAKGTHANTHWLMSWAALPNGVLDVQIDDELNVEIELAFTA